MNGNNVTYFDSFRVEYIPQGIKKCLDSKIIITSIYREQVYDSAMWGYFCLGFIDFMLNNTNLFCSNNFKKNDKIIPEYQ